MSKQKSDSGLISFCPAVLLACIAISPLYLVEPYKGPALSPVYTCACLAFLVGQVLGLCLRAHVWLEDRGRRLLLFSVALLIEVFVLPEWELLGDYASVLLASGSPEYLGLIAQMVRAAQIPALSIASALAGLVSVPHPSSAAPTDARSSASKLVSLASLTMAVAYSSRVIWLAIFPLEGSTGRVLPLTAAGVGITLSALATALVYMAVAGLLARKWHALCLPGSAFGAAYAMGMLLWSLLARVAPLYRGLVSSLVPVLVLVAVALLTRSLPKLPRSACVVGEDSKAVGARPALPAQIANAGLSARELQVTELALEGRASAQIASELGLSASTVRGTLAKAYKKIGVSNLDQLKTLGEPVTHAAAAGASETVETGSSLISARQIVPAVLVALPLLPVAVVSRGWGQGQPLLMGAGFALVSVSIVHLLMDKPMISKVRAFDGRRVAVMAITATADLIALIAVFCQSIHAAILPSGVLNVLEFASGASTVLLSIAFLPETVRAKDNHALSASLACVSFTLGLALEELWRFASGVSGLLGLLPFLLATGYSLLRSHAASKAKPSRLCSPLSSASLYLALGCGVLFGVFALNLLGDRLLVWQEALGVPIQTGMLLCFATALASVPGLISIYIIYRNMCLESPVQLAPTSAERIEGYLVSQGLTSTEVQTALNIAQNLTTRQIATQMNYSVGTINSARRGAYAKLNIRSKEDLLNLFAQFKDA